MKILYAVRLIIDGWNTVNVIPIFITENEEYAKKYCFRGNKILNKYEPYYAKLHNELMRDYDETHERDADYVHIQERFHFVSGFFSYNLIEMR